MKVLEEEATKSVSSCATVLWRGGPKDGEVFNPGSKLNIYSLLRSSRVTTFLFYWQQSIFQLSQDGGSDVRVRKKKKQWKWELVLNIAEKIGISPLMCAYINLNGLCSTNLVFKEELCYELHVSCSWERLDFLCFLNFLPFERREIHWWFGGNKPARSGLIFPYLWGGLCVLLCTFLYSPFDIITVGFSNLVKYIYFYQRYLIFFFMTT